MLRVVVIVIVAMLMVYSVVDIAISGRYKVRVMPRWLWLATVICLPLIGSTAWLIFGRPRTSPPKKDPAAPDDDPDFLRSL